LESEEVTAVFAAGVLSPPPNREKMPPPESLLSESGSRKYLDPEEVCTTLPPSASVVMGEVDTASPSSKLGDPLIKPEIPPSRFCFQLDIIGTPRGALDADFLGGAALAGLLTAGGAVSSLVSALSPNNPKREIVAPGFAVFKAAALFWSPSRFFTSTAAA